MRGTRLHVNTPAKIAAYHFFPAVGGPQGCQATPLGSDWLSGMSHDCE
jgi:hypothetical protein